MVWRRVWRQERLRAHFSVFLIKRVILKKTNKQTNKQKKTKKKKPKPLWIIDGVYCKKRSYISLYPWRFISLSRADLLHTLNG